MQKTVSLKKYLLTVALGFGLGGLLWGWFFGSNAYSGDPGFAISYWFNGILFGLLGGLSLFIFFKNRKDIFWAILFGAVGGFVGFLIGENVGIPITYYIILPIIGLIYYIIPSFPAVGHYLVYGEIVPFLLSGAILTTSYVLVIDKKPSLMLPKNKKQIFFNIFILIIGAGYVLIDYWEKQDRGIFPSVPWGKYVSPSEITLWHLDYKMLIAVILFVLIFNFILRVDKKFRSIIFYGAIGLSASYFLGVFVAESLSGILEQISEYWLLWSYIIRFVVAGIIFGTFLSWKIHKHLSDFSTEEKSLDANN